MELYDQLYEEAKQIVIESQECSPRQLQIKLKIGYMRADRFVEKMEKEGIVSPFSLSKDREVLIKVTTTNDHN